MLRMFLGVWVRKMTAPVCKIAGHLVKCQILQNCSITHHLTMPVPASRL